MLRGWHAWFGTFTGVVAVTVLLLPVAALVVWALARRRRALGAAPGSGVAAVAGRGRHRLRDGADGVDDHVAGQQGGHRSGEPDTAAGSGHDRRADGPAAAAVQIVGNLLVFAALGFFAPMRFRALASLPRILALAAGCSIVVETLQLVLPLDRVSSVDDVLLNTVGAGLAALAARRWWCP